MSKILVLNAGNSSLKYKLFNIIDDQKLVEEKSGSISSIGSPDGPKNHKVALTLLFEGYGISAPNLAKIKDLKAIGHRVVHGGTKFTGSVEVNQVIIDELKKYNNLAPLHNPPIIEVMEFVLKNTGRSGHRNIPSYAIFDTSFYKNLPEETKIYPLPYYYYERDGIQRFGFHGLSHQNVVEEVTKIYPDRKKIISIHLGAGSSITAIDAGKVVDTSMGFTPQEGLMMTTRSGDIDPGIIPYLIRRKELKYHEIDELLNNESGLLGVSGVSASMMDILYAAGYKVEDPNYDPPSKIKRLPEVYRGKAKLAIKMFVYRIKKYIGAYQAILGGCDILAFTGKIGAGSSLIREMVVDRLDHILDQSKIVVVIPDEELQIAKEIVKFSL